MPVFLILIWVIYKVFMLFNRKKESINHAKKILEKLYKLNHLTLDHKGQKLKDKFYDDLIYRDNPLRREREEDLEDIQRLNSEIERLKDRQEFMAQQKRDLAEDNRQLLQISAEYRFEIDVLNEKKKK